MDKELTASQKIEKTLTTGYPQAHEWPAANFANPPGIRDFLFGMKQPRLRVEIIGSKEALAVAGLAPGLPVDGVPVHEGATDNVGHLRFKFGRTA